MATSNSPEPAEGEERPCRACRGTGTEFRDPDEPCRVCHGEAVELNLARS